MISIYNKVYTPYDHSRILVSLPTLGFNQKKTSREEKEMWTEICFANSSAELTWTYLQTGLFKESDEW